MHILVERLTHLIKYQGYDFAYEGDDGVEMYLDGFVEFKDCSLNRHNSDVFDVAEIADFIGDKYKYVDGEVVDNQDWVNPDKEL